MFALRGLIVSLSVFAIVYCILSLAISFSWRRVYRSARRQPVRRIADLLFCLRLFPLAGAVVVTAALTVPSFLLFEPRSIEEPIHPGLIALAICSIGLGIFGAVNAASALLRVSRAISSWTSGAESLQASTTLPVLRIPRNTPAMTAVGIVHPKVLVSGAAQFVLTENEMQTALNHEIAHVRRRDNLKKLLLRIVACPGMRGLEGAWLECTEMAADDAAVSSATEALDLAAALVKLSRLAPLSLPMDLTVAVVAGPISVVNARVERLISWSERPAARSVSLVWPLTASAGLMAASAITYSQLLIRIHAATEWLVR